MTVKKPKIGKIIRKMSSSFTLKLSPSPSHRFCKSRVVYGCTRGVRSPGSGTPSWDLVSTSYPTLTFTIDREVPVS